MKSFLVIGLGRFGTAVALELSMLHHDVVAIEEDEARAEVAAEKLTHVVIGDAKDEAVLKSVGVRNFDGVIVATTNIEDSVMITLLAKEMGANYVICKVLSDSHAKVLSRIGADRVVFPERDMGARVAQIVSSSNVLDFIELSDEFAIVEMPTPGKWVGKSLIQLSIRASYGVNVLAIKHGKEVSINIEPKYRFRAEDVVVVLGSDKQIRRLESL
ncbi:MAG: potassium channel family protein [Butyricicoccaceae bacterium]